MIGAEPVLGGPAGPGSGRRRWRWDRASASWSAKIAVRTITSMIAPPAAPSGFFRQNRASTVHAAGAARSAGEPRSRAGRPSGLSWHIAPVGPGPRRACRRARFEDDHHDGHDHHEVLDDGVVAPEDRLHEKPGEAGKVEHRLRHHEAADEEGELDADDGHHGQDGVLERMPPDDDPPPTAPWPTPSGHSPRAWTSSSEERVMRMIRAEER